MENETINSKNNEGKYVDNYKGLNINVLVWLFSTIFCNI
jgi:hypothetical protein